MSLWGTITGRIRAAPGGAAPGGAAPVAVVVVAVVAVAAVALIGLFVIRSSSPTRTAPSSPPYVDLASADQGRTVTLHLSQIVQVSLDGGRSNRWTAPASADAGILQPLRSTADPAAGGATGRFQARSAGTTKLTSDESARCRIGTPCPAFVRLWSVTVRVVA